MSRQAYWRPRMVCKVCALEEADVFGVKLEERFKPASAEEVKDANPVRENTVQCEDCNLLLEGR